MQFISFTCLISTTLEQLYTVCIMQSYYNGLRDCWLGFDTRIKFIEGFYFRTDLRNE
jgi:hypothetical protein